MNFATLVIMGLVLAVSGCERATVTTTTPPAQANLTPVFPSFQAALFSDSIVATVFDGALEGTDCPTLLLRRKTGQDLPPALVESTSFTPCEAFTAGAPPLLVTYGLRRVLVVASKDKTPSYTGCGEVTVTAEGAQATIPLQRADSAVPVPVTACPSLTEFCKGTCK